MPFRLSFTTSLFSSFSPISKSADASEIGYWVSIYVTSGFCLTSLK